MTKKGNCVGKKNQYTSFIEKIMYEKRKNSCKKTVLVEIDDLLKKIWQKLLTSLPCGNTV